MDEDELYAYEEIAKILLSANKDAFSYYFIDLNPPESHPNPELAQVAKDIFKEYNKTETFEEFVKKFQEACKAKKEKRKHGACTQTPDPIEPNQDLPSVEMDKVYNWNPPRRVSVLPPFRKRRRTPSFNVVDFLVQKKKSDEVFSFKLQTDETVQEVLSTLETTEKKKMSLLADGVLRKIAEHVELLNQMYDYRMLQINYEH